MPGTHFLQSLLATRSSLSGFIAIDRVACSVCCLEFYKDVCFNTLCMALACRSTFSLLEEIDKHLHVESAGSQTEATGASEPTRSLEYLCSEDYTERFTSRLGFAPWFTLSSHPSGCHLHPLLPPQSYTYTHIFWDRVSCTSGRPGTHMRMAIHF